MAAAFIYANVDNKWIQFASKGDRVQFNSQGQIYQGIVDSASPISVIVTLLNGQKQVEIKHNAIQFVERRQTTQNNIPIEIGDLVSFTVDGTSYTGIINTLDISAAVVTVDVISNPKVGRQLVTVNKVLYLAKGYSLNNTTISSSSSIGQGANSSAPSPAHVMTQANVQGTPTQITSAQNASQIALLYPAPCVVMAVPYNTNPDSFPEAMYVQMPDRAPGQPVLLPVVRMGCDTALVVVPPIKGRAQSTVNVTPQKASAPNKPTVGV